MIDSSPKQQAVELIRQAKSILVATHKNPDGDALGSIIALKLALEKLDKKVEIVCPDQPGELFAFLPAIADVKTEIPQSRELVISVDTRNSEVDKIGYKKDGDRVNIVVTAKSGNFTPENVKIEPPKAKFDLVIVVDTPNIERLGSLSQPADVFYETPVINIDHHPSNERFGKVNWVELVATATTEILVSLFEALGRETKLFDEDVATALLTGLIYDTSSFQNINTTPKSLTVAAQLVAAGGKQQEIIKHLYKTKALSTLKLWGIILSQVKEDKSHKFLWSSVSHEDLLKVGADESALSGVVDELLKSATDVDFVLLLSERQDQVHGSLRAIAKGVNVAEIAENFGGGGHEMAAAFRYDGSLKDSEEKILDRIRQLKIKSAGVQLPSVQAPETDRPQLSSSKGSQREEETKGKEEVLKETEKSMPGSGEISTDKEVEKSELESDLKKEELDEMPDNELRGKPEIVTKLEEPKGQPDLPDIKEEKPFESPVASSSEPLDLAAELSATKDERTSAEPTKDEDRPRTKW